MRRWIVRNFQILIVPAIKICKQCLQTASASGGRSPQTPCRSFAPSHWGFLSPRTPDAAIGCCDTYSRDAIGLLMSVERWSTHRWTTGQMLWARICRVNTVERSQCVTNRAEFQQTLCSVPSVTVACLSNTIATMCMRTACFYCSNWGVVLQAGCLLQLSRCHDHAWKNPRGSRVRRPSNYVGSEHVALLWRVRRNNGASWSTLSYRRDDR